MYGKQCEIMSTVCCHIHHKLNTVQIYCFPSVHLQKFAHIQYSVYISFLWLLSWVPSRCTAESSDSKIHFVPSLFEAREEQISSLKKKEKKKNCDCAGALQYKPTDWVLLYSALWTQYQVFKRKKLHPPEREQSWDTRSKAQAKGVHMFNDKTDTKKDLFFFQLLLIVI